MSRHVAAITDSGGSGPHPESEGASGSGGFHRIDHIHCGVNPGGSNRVVPQRWGKKFTLRRDFVCRSEKMAYLNDCPAVYAHRLRDWLRENDVTDDIVLPAAAAATSG
jgi:hypothetical protein